MKSGDCGTTSSALKRFVGKSTLVALRRFKLFDATNGIVPGNGYLADPLSSIGIALVPAGTIDWTTSATNTGAITWSVSYVPYDPGAYITAL